MALTNVKLDDKTELTLNAESVDFIYILKKNIFCKVNP